jgi:hypothetical protein
VRRESCTRAVGSAPCRPPACVLAHSPREPPSLVPALGQLSVWTPRRGYTRRYAICISYVSERRPASGHARLNPCAGEMQIAIYARSSNAHPWLCPHFCRGFGPRAGSRPAGNRGGAGGGAVGARAPRARRGKPVPVGNPPPASRRTPVRQDRIPSVTVRFGADRGPCPAAVAGR